MYSPVHSTVVKVEFPGAETADPRWNWLYRIGGAAALITVVLIPVQIIVFIAWPPPYEGTVTDWFTLFQDNRLLGLLSLDLLLIVDYVLLVPIFSSPFTWPSDEPVSLS